jgi:hypothetical protein
MKIEIKEEGDTITVSVQIRPYHRKNHNAKIRFGHGDALKHLSGQKIEVGKCISSTGLATNKFGPELLSGEWVFEKPKPKKPVQTRKKSKKVKKTLDKSPEDVIIEVQEKTLPSKEE